MRAGSAPHDRTPGTAPARQRWTTGLAASLPRLRGLRTRGWRGWLPVRVARRYMTSDAGHWGTNMAWNALFSFIPILLLVATLAGLSFHSTRLETYLARVTAPIFHTTPARLLAVFGDVRDKFWLFAVLGVAGLVWSGSALFSCVDSGLSRLSGFAPRPFVRRRRMAIRMTAVFCLLLIPLLVSSSALSVPRGRMGWLDVLARFGRPFLIGEQFVLGALIATVLFLHVYRVAPNRGFPQRRRSVLPGALAAGVLLELLALMFPLYIDASGTNGGAALLLALPALLTFFYCVGNIIVIGHLVNLETGDIVAAPLPPPHPPPGA